MENDMLNIEQYLKDNAQSICDDLQDAARGRGFASLCIIVDEDGVEHNTHHLTGDNTNVITKSSTGNCKYSMLVISKIFANPFCDGPTDYPQDFIQDLISENQSLIRRLQDNPQPENHTSHPFWSEIY
jgi:hypothetical protein